MSKIMAGEILISQMRFAERSAAPEIAVKDLSLSNTAWKVLTYVPLIGHVISSWSKISIDTEIMNTTKAARLVELIQLKNSYMNIDGIRNVATVAVLVAAVAFGLFTPTFGGTLMGMAVGSLIVNAFNFWNNQHTVHKLQSKGFFFPAMVN